MDSSFLYIFVYRFASQYKKYSSRYTTNFTTRFITRYGGLQYSLDVFQSMAVFQCQGSTGDCYCSLFVASTMMDPQAEGRNDTLRRQTVTDTPETLLTQKEMYGQSKESGPTVTFEFYTAGTCSSVSSFRCHVAPGEELATSSPILRNSAATRTLENRGAEILHRECSRSEGMSYR